MPINNAYLELFRLYYESDDFLFDLLKKSGGDLPAFIAAAKTLEKKDPAGITNPKERLAKALGIEYP